MGNEQQKKQQNGEVMIVVNHPKFTNVKLVSEGSKKQMQLSMGVDEKEYERWKQSLTKAKLESTALLLPTKDEFSRKGFCGDSGTLKLNYDNFSYLLTEEIYNRNGRKSKFEEWELWYLLLSLSAAQQEVKKKTGNKVGDIRPHNVFLNSEGDVKVSTTYSWPRESTNFNKTFDNQKTYLAPEDMVRIEMGTMEDSSNFSSEVFSIGLTVLSAAMLEDFLKLYDIKAHKFNAEEATILLNEWKSNTVYSEIFTALVSNLCSFQPLKRLEDKELWSWISKYEQPIRAKEDFVIEEAPIKVEQEIQQIRRLFPADEPVYPPQELQVGNQYGQVPFNDKSMVESYLPPQNQFVPPTYAHHPDFQQGVQRLPSPRVIPTDPRVFIEERTQGRLEDTQTRYQQPGQVYRVSEPLQRQYGQPLNYLPPLPQEYTRRTIATEGELSPEYLRRPPIVQNQLPPQFGGRGAIIGGQIPPQYGQLPPQLIGRASVGEKQLPPQFVGRTVNQTYISSPRGLPPRPQVGEVERRGTYLPNGQSNIAYYQNIVDPQGVRGGRFQETVYIQRPELGQQYEHYYEQE